MKRIPRSLLVLVLLAVVAAACGQKSGVNDVATGPVGGGGQSGAVGGGTGDGGAAAPADAGTGGAGGTGTEGGAGGAGAGEAPAGDGGTGAGEAPAGAPAPDAGEAPPPGGGAAAPAPAPEGGGAPAGSFSAGPNDKVGHGNEIVIGIHAPITGAAAIPNTSLERGKDVYFKFLKDAKGGVYGKKNVRVVIHDDEFNPVKAREVCQSMVEKEKVFLLVGAAGADQITACAAYANSAGVPYLSAGVNEEGIGQNRTYFAISATYSQQSLPLAQFIKNRVKKTTVGIVVADTRSFDDAQRSFTKAAKDVGLKVVYNERINKDASQAEALAVMNEMSSKKVEVVYLLASPNVFINMASTGQSQNYRPRFIGPGNTSGINIIGAACPSVDKAIFFSSFMQLDKIDAFDKDFKAAYRKYAGAEPDDFGISFWGLEKTLALMFEAAGEGMGRASFMNTLESGKAFASNVYPPGTYSVRNHFGAPQVNVLQMDCAARQFRTIDTFKSSF